MWLQKSAYFMKRAAYKLFDLQSENIKESKENRDFHEYVQSVRISLAKESAILSNRLKVYTKLRAFLLVLLPVSLVVFNNPKSPAMIIAAALIYIEFLTNINDLPNKLHDLDKVLNDIDHENNMFAEHVGKYRVINEENEKAYKEKIIELINNADNTITNKFKLEAAQEEVFEYSKEAEADLEIEDTTVEPKVEAISEKADVIEIVEPVSESVEPVVVEPVEVVVEEENKEEAPEIIEHEEPTIHIVDENGEEIKEEEAVS